MFLDFDVKVSVGKIAEVQSIDTRSRYELAPLEENEITGTVPLSFTARMGRLTGYKIYGNSRHEESPNLIIDWLSKISTTYQCTMEKTATSLTIHSTGGVKSGYPGTWNGSDTKFTVKPNTTYRLSWDYVGTRDESFVCIFPYISGNPQASFTLPFINGSGTFTTDANVTEIGMTFNLRGTDENLLTTADYLTVSNLMLEENPTGEVVYRPYGGTILAVGDLVSSGTYAGKYRIPVTITGTGNDTQTVDIYLNEPLRKVGAYADYIDFERQKVCRVIKTVTTNGDSWNSYSQNNQFSISCIHLMNKLPLVDDNSVMTESSLYPGASAADEWQNRSTTDYRCIAVNDTHFELLVVDNISFPSRNLTEFGNLLRQLYNAGTPMKIWYINSDSDDTSDPPTAAVYEEESITLPALSVYGGSNTLTVGTEVQPSEVEVKGKIKGV